jgi:hypothetical protein
MAFLKIKVMLFIIIIKKKLGSRSAEILSLEAL